MNAILPDWNVLLRFLPIFEAEDFDAGSWVTPKDGFSYFDASEAVSDFDEALYSSEIIQPFDWAEWSDEAERLMNDPTALANADLDTIQKLLTVHSRKARFCEGHWASVIDTGHIRDILRRVDEVLRNGS